MSFWKNVFGGGMKKVKFDKFSAVKKKQSGVLCGVAKNCVAGGGALAPVLSEIAGPKGGGYDYYEDNDGIHLILIKDDEKLGGETFSYVGDRGVVYRFEPNLQAIVGEGFDVSDDGYIVRLFNEKDVEEFAVCTSGEVTVYEPNGHKIFKQHIGDSRIAFCFHERLFVASDYTLFYTAPADYTDWGPDADGGGEIRFASDDGKIAGGGALGENVYLLFERGIKKLDLRGAARDFTAKDVACVLDGEIFVRSVAVAAKSLVFATSRGVFAFSEKAGVKTLCSAAEFLPSSEPDCKCLAVGNKAYLFYTDKLGARRAFVACPETECGYFLNVDGLQGFSVAKEYLYYYDAGVVYRLGEKVEKDAALCHFGDSSFKVENSTFGVDGEKLFKTMKIKGEGVCRVVAEGARGKHGYLLQLSSGEKMVCPLLKGKTFSLTFELTKGCKIDGVELAFACCK